MSYSSIPWLLLTAILTALGLVLSYGILRRSGVRPALRVAAVSLVPIAAYLTGATEMLWKIGVAIGQFGTGFAFSTTKWVGIGVTGLAIALFLAAGGREARRAARDKRRAALAGRQDDEAEVASGAGRRGALAGSRTSANAGLPANRAPVPATRAPAPPTQAAKASRRAAPDDDDDLKDIEDILRKRGI